MTDNNKPHTVIIADAQYLITTSLKIILQDEKQYCVSQVVNTKYDLLKALKTQLTSLLIVDFTLIDFDSLSDLKDIKKQYPDLSILVLANSVNKNELLELNSIGIHNIILKTVERDDLFAALEATTKGKKYYSEEVLELLFEVKEKKSFTEEHDKQLTVSEVEIVRLISEGLTTKEIAIRKHISFHTVMSHRKNIFRKLNVNSASELLMYAIKAGIIDTIEYNI
jgi:DNA-binding NarL/FixJ family response regulator